MSTQILDRETETTDNEHKYWESPFSPAESVEHVHSFESNKLEAQVKCGLELWRAQLNLRHGAWYPYLLKCGMTQPTAWNRKKRAKDYLVWARLLGPDDKITEEHVHQGLELACGKSLNINDFREYLVQLNIESIRESLQRSCGFLRLPIPLPHFPVVGLMPPEWSS